MRPEARAALRSIFQGIDRLRSAYDDTGRRFTIDGRLVGDIGEAIARVDYGVELHKNQRMGTDGTLRGKGVQVKATFGTQLTFTKRPPAGILLLCFQLVHDGTYFEAYSGPSERLAEKFWPGNSKSQRRPSVDDLAEIAAYVTRQDRIPRQRKGTLCRKT